MDQQAAAAQSCPELNPPLDIIGSFAQPAEYKPTKQQQARQDDEAAHDSGFS